MINIKKFIKENSDISYAEFSRKFITTKYQIAGVRTPTLRKFAKMIEPEYVEMEENPTHEEILLYAFSAGMIKSKDKQLEYLENVLPYIDNWATSDGVSTSLKRLTGEKSYQFLTELLKDEREFYVRVAVVLLMRNFMKTEKLDEILTQIKDIRQNDYYVKMAVAWFYAELCTYDFARAKKQIEETTDKFTRNRAISKAIESFRVDKPKKEELAKLRLP